MKIIKSSGGLNRTTGDEIKEAFHKKNKENAYQLNSEPPLPYHIYVKHPNGKRFLKATIKGYETVIEAHDYLNEIMGYEKSVTGTKYQIRQGRKVIFQAKKEEGGLLLEVYNESL